MTDAPTPDRRILAEVMLPVSLNAFAAVAKAFEADHPRATLEPLGDRYRLWSQPE